MRPAKVRMMKRGRRSDGLCRKARHDELIRKKQRDRVLPVKRNCSSYIRQSWFS
ncbi:predicted protein [Brucella abortus bv. 4 str. 292]|uniref:Uncharacterized protein n=10 Tax=Brucella TaxID=234 RepID=Q2YKB9_BRUA2|nr:hypothetical protein BRA0493 [Brucella suis 1330]AAX76135.1 hypothetical protein BruAb2_0729 [Brucella abortus bv. 1 str. 9-941]ACU49621.1 hypothetical protein BMI_II489 [Brucella microti CCM 4915]AEK55919.1 hypothetical protein BPI_II476 [Brucella pinnipedialis B2/94]AEU07633.1 hypothetical protein BSVBI22_B0488 [Brucella suis VBI22]AHN48232.1 hypothetical protein BSS2_II0469 [Brucella suis bv. 1 str. S2]EEX57425.1 predicted protein [Brucella abortus bv. 4 str. 292]EEX60647.1 predicted p